MNIVDPSDSSTDASVSAPDGPNDDDVLIKARQWFKEASTKTSDWRTQAQEDYAFYAGDQWSQEDMAILKEQMRPPITFNRCGIIMDAVSGMEIGNRQEVKYIPRETGDSAVNEAMTETARWVRDECDAEDEESEAFKDACICGVGVTNTRLDYIDNQDGMPIVERQDPLSKYWDPNATKRNLADRRYDFSVTEMDADEAEAMFPDFDRGDLHAGWASDYVADQDQTNLQIVDVPDQYKNPMTRDPSTWKTVKIVEMQWWELEPYYRVIDGQSGQESEFTSEQYAKLRKRAKQADVPIKGIQQKRKVYYKAFLGNVTLEVKELDVKGFTYKFITGKRDRNTNTWFGVMRWLKDPQRWSNKWLSQTIHIYNSNPKGGLIAERDAFENPRQAENDYSRPDKITWLNPGAIAGKKIDYKPTANFPTGIDHLMQFAISAIPWVSGVSIETLGLSDRQQAGVVEYQRKQSSMTTLAGLFDSLRQYRKDQGKLLMTFIQTYLPPDTLVRVLGPNYIKYVPLLKDPMTAEYDVIVSDSPTSPNQKEATWGMLTQLLPVLIKVVPPQVLLPLLKNSPLPISVVEEITQEAQKAMQAMQAKPDPKVQQAQQLMQMKGAQTKQQMDLAAQSANQDMQINQQKADQDLAIQAAKANADLQQAGMEGQMQQWADGWQMQNAQAQHGQKMDQNQQAFEQKQQQQQIIPAIHINGESVGATMGQNAQALQQLGSDFKEGMMALAKGLSALAQVTQQNGADHHAAQMETNRLLSTPKKTQIRRQPDGSLEGIVGHA